MQLNLPFNLPIVAVALLIGICSTIWLPELPTQHVAYVLLLIASLGVLVRPRNWFAIISVAIFGFAFMVCHINVQLERSLPNSIENQPIIFTGNIISVVEELKTNKVKFLFDVRNTADLQLVWPNPGLVQVTWDGAPTKIAPGDKWLLTLKLKRPRNYANPGSFDTEKFFFQQRIAALGYVVSKGKHELLAKDLDSQPINNLRHDLLKTMRQSMKGQEFAGVVIALVLGIKTKLLTASQMQVLQNTGTAHLMSISGLHIGLVATLMFFVLRMLWRFGPARLMQMPAPWLAAWGALLASIFYAFLAGFSIATQRSLIMVIIFLSGLLFKRKISSMQSYSLALIAVLLWDPFAVLAMGFWLSFAAVGFLLYAYSGRDFSKSNKAINWLRPQFIIFVGLLPVTLLFFSQASLIAPVANLLAIPWVSFLVVPFSLAGAFVLSFDASLATELFKIAEHNVALLWPILEELNRFEVLNWTPPSQHLWVVIISATVGALWILAPRGIPGRWWGILGFMPLLFNPGSIVPYGHAEFTLLDVGQGLAAVVRTQNHVLVYDTGAKLSDDFDLGSRVVAPYLKTKGIKQVSTLMISHADNDHIGGAGGLLQRIPANDIMINDTQYLSEFAPQICKAGQRWEWDGVKFYVLHPDGLLQNKKRNDQSCVLLVKAGNHTALLTGDIEAKSEKQLLQRYGEQLRSDIIIVPHHGSKTSSSLEFLQQVNPQFAIIPVGHLNQYGHPKQEILQRYSDLDINILRTDHHGAISFKLGANDAKLQGVSFREQHGRFWSTR